MRLKNEILNFICCKNCNNCTSCIFNLKCEYFRNLLKKQFSNTQEIRKLIKSGIEPSDIQIINLKSDNKNINIELAKADSVFLEIYNKQPEEYKNNIRIKMRNERYSRQYHTYGVTLASFTNEADLKYLYDTDLRAAAAIKQLENEIQEIKKYREALFEYTQEVINSKKTLVLEFLRRQDYSKKHIYFTIELKEFSEISTGFSSKIYEKYTGKERRQALKRFEELKKDFPKAEIKTNI